MEKQMIFPIIDELSMILPYSIAGVGIDYEQEPISRGEDFKDYQWIQCVSGEGILIIDGKSYPVKAQQGMFLRPQEVHEYHAVTSSWKVDWVIFHGDQVAHLLEAVIGLRRSGVYGLSRPEIIVDRIHQIYAIEKSQDFLKKISSAQVVYSMLLDLMKYVTTQTNKSNEVKYERIQPVIAFIESHYEEVIEIDALAALLAITPQYLCTLFKKITSTTITQYINMTRIRRSKELMFGNHPIAIKEVAHQVGFTDVSYFCAMFKRLEHITPAQYKLMHGIQG